MLFQFSEDVQFINPKPQFRKGFRPSKQGSIGGDANLEPGEDSIRSRIMKRLQDYHRSLIAAQLPFYQCCFKSEIGCRVL